MLTKILNQEEIAMKKETLPNKQRFAKNVHQKEEEEEEITLIKVPFEPNSISLARLFRPLGPFPEFEKAQNGCWNPL